MSKIQENAILVKVQIKKWSNTKRDANLSDELATAKAAKSELLRVNKTLIDSPQVKALSKIGGQITNNILRRLCVPWDDGVHLLKVELIDKFEEELRKKRDYWDELVRELGDEYESQVRRARIALGDAFDESDYPSRDDVMSRYSITVEYRPLPEGNDIRVNLPQHKLEQLRSDVESQVTSRVEQAMETVHERVVDTLQSLIEGLERHGQKGADAKRASKFSDNTVNKISELADILPALNITGDPKLTSASNDLLTKLRDLDADELRSDEAKRQSTAETAKSIVSNLTGFYD